MKCKFLAALSLAATIFYSCDDETTGIGQFVANEDIIPTSADAYDVTTSSLQLKQVYSRSSTAYLGKFTDKSFGEFSSDFLVQINCPEDFEMPNKITEISGATLGLYYNSYFGDSLASMRLQVDTLNKIITDDGTDKGLYYTNLDPKSYYDHTQKPLAVKDYSTYDLTVSDSLRNLSTYYPNVSIDLGKDFCNKLLTDYKQHPEYFKNSESFIRNVLKGFYVHTTRGEGSILYISNIYLDLKIKYTGKTSDGLRDSTYATNIPMASTKEVFMSTRFQNPELDSEGNEFLNNEKCTYLKTPAGLCTEVVLPLEEMYQEHKNDTLNSISVSFQKMKDTYAGAYKMGTPSTLLMVRKAEMKSFFEDNKVYDNKTSFIAAYSSTTNAYAFSKLNRLISSIFSEIKPEVEKGTVAWEAWKQANPDWNKVVLVPVSTETDSKGNIIGVSNNLQVNSAMLLRSTNANKIIKMKVIYSQPNRK